MLARRFSVTLTSVALAAAFSFGCSSSSNNAPDGAAGSIGTAGRDAGAAGAGGGDASAGSDGAAGGGGSADAAPSEAGDAPADAAQDGFPSDAISPDVIATDSASSIAVTSPSLLEGTAFAAANTCAGANTSPAIAWTAGPAGTMSYAVVLTDLSIDAIHWVIWDIPAATTSLPAGLPGDTTLTTPVAAKQVHKVEFFGAGGAYRGPCPSGKNHIYQFEVNAIAAATLGGVSTTSNTDVVKAAVQAASLAHGDLDGTSNATAPPADAGGQ